MLEGKQDLNLARERDWESVRRASTRKKKRPMIEGIYHQWNGHRGVLLVRE